MNKAIVTIPLLASLIFGTLLCGSRSRADVLNDSRYRVSVDTRQIEGATGFIDFQFNPADAAAPTYSAVVSNFSGSISLLNDALTEGAVTGQLPNALQLVNSSAFNDYFQAVQFGSTFSFDIGFSGNQAQANNSGTSFALSLFANDGLSPLLTTDPNATLLTMQLVLDPIAPIQLFTFLSDNAGSPSVVTVTPVPLPAALLMLVSGLGVFPWVIRRRIASSAIPSLS